MVFSFGFVQKMSHVKQSEKVDVKLGRLADKIEEIERNKFHEHFPENPKLLYQELFKHKKQIDGLTKSKNKKRGVITDEQYDLLFPSNGQTHSEQFDTTLLHILLRNFCGYQKPSTGWDGDPAPNDRTPFANLIRLKNNGRNQIKHLSRFEKTEKKYKAIYHNVKQPLLDLGCSQADLQNLLPTAVRYKYVQPIPEFTARDDELKKIHTEMISLGNNTSYQGVVVFALGGVGKSELAKQYFKNHEQYYDNNVVWINASLLQSSFQDLAEYLELKVKDRHGNFKPINVVVKEVLNYFADDKVLFIFDNADQRNGDNNQSSAVGEIIQYLPQSPLNYSLITSQITNWPSHFKTFSLELLPKEESVKFVLDRLQLKESTKALTAIIDWFGGGYLLGLQHFVTYVKEKGASFEDYLRLLKSQPEKLRLDRGGQVMSAINVNIGRITADSNTYSQLAQNILHTIRFLNGKEIKRGFFIALKYGDKSDEDENARSVNEALFLLKKYSLVTITSSDSGEPKDDIISVHSMVQETLKVVQRVSNTEIAAHNNLLDNFTQDGYSEFLHMRSIDFQSFDYWYKQLIYLFHQKVRRENFVTFFATNAHYLSDVLLNRGAFDVCEEMLAEALKQYQELLGAGRPKTIWGKLKALFTNSSKENITLYYRLQYLQGHLLNEKMEHDEAVVILRGVLTKQEKRLGRKHKDSLRTSLEVMKAQWESSGIGENTYEDTVKRFKNLNDLQKKVLGKTHPETLSCTHCLYVSKWIIDRNIECLHLFEDLLKKLHNLYSDIHPCLVETKLYHAKLVRALGTSDQTLEVFKYVFDVCLKIYPSGHPKIVFLKM